LYNYDTGAGWVEFDNVTVEQTNNLISDGDMEADGVGEWSNSLATLSKQGDAYEGSQVLQVAYLANPNPYAYQTIQTVGKKYRLTGRARGDLTGEPRIADGGTYIWTGSTATAWQEIDVTYIATNAVLRLYNVTAGASFTEFDSIQVREVFETVGAWDARDVTGRTLPDRSGNGNHGTLGGSCAPVNTEMGRALGFDGATGYASASSPFVPAGDNSLSFLFRVSAHSALGAILSAGNSVSDAGAYLIKSGFDKRAEAQIHMEALEELGQSLEDEVAPQVFSLDDRTITLTGSVEEQYAQWREILADLYAAELGQL